MLYGRLSDWYSVSTQVPDLWEVKQEKQQQSEPLVLRYC